MSEEHFARLVNMYKAAPCNEIYNPDISIQKGSAQISIPVRSSMFHAGGSLHGSVFFKLLDDSAYFAASSLEEKHFILTSSFNCYFLKPVSSGVLSAEGKVKNISKRMYVAESVLINASGQTVARGSGSFISSRIELESELGYRL